MKDVAPEVATFFRELEDHLRYAEDVHRETERVVQEYVREEKQKPQSLGRAFKLMLFEEAIHEKLGLPADKVLWYRDHYRAGGYVAPEEMQEMLQKAGWRSNEVDLWQGRQPE